MLINKSKPLVLALLIAMGGLLTYFLLLGQPIWGENDDVAMSLISAGVWFAKEPSAGLFFIHPLYGAVISNLYKWQPSIPWYALAFLLVIGMALASMNYAILRLPKFPKNIYGYLLLIFANLATVLPALWHLQFTVVAGLATLAGCILLLSFYIFSPGKPQTWIVGIASGMLLVLTGAMIRLDSMLLVLILVAPTGLILLLKEIIAKKNVKSRNSYLANLVIVLLIFGSVNLGLHLIQKNYYSSPEWQRWFALNKVKAEFIDFNRISYNQETADIFTGAGLTENDYHMIKSWQYVDPAHYTPEKLNQVVSGVFAQGLEAQVSLNDYANLRRFFSVLWNAAKPTSAILLCALIPAVLTGYKNKFGLLVLITIASSFIAVYSYMHFGLNRLQFRVLLVLFITFLWTILLIFSNYHQHSHPRKATEKQLALLVLVIVSMFLSLTNNFHNARYQVYKTVKFQQGIEKLMEEWQAHLPDKAIIYMVGGSFRSEYHLPLKSFDYLATIQGFIGAGWPNQSPLQREVIGSLNLNPDEFYLSLSNQPHVYVVAPGEFRVYVLSQFYQEKYNIRLYLTPEPNLPNLYRMNFLHPTKDK
jgi:hypothetical protein